MVNRVRQTGCRLYPLCVDSSVCRGDCVRYMRATARDRNAVKAQIAAMKNKRSRPKAAEGACIHELEPTEPCP